MQADPFESSVRQQRIRARIARHLAPNPRRILPLPVAARFDADEQMHFVSLYDILVGSDEVEPLFADAAS